MKKIIQALIFFIVFINFSYSNSFKNGNDLYREWEEYKTDKENPFNKIVYMGFVVGVFDATNGLYLIETDGVNVK